MIRDRALIDGFVDAVARFVRQKLLPATEADGTSRIQQLVIARRMLAEAA